VQLVVPLVQLVVQLEGQLMQLMYLVHEQV
jgi:hypothetical protein